ncbi:EAL domain-containing protein [Shewanella electrodiphila]|uniref:EAL domain-containing protein n=1 Tax=Shewanella electrodiphila TaxID=934143 RepID=A0ABT0KRT2_9GAMM|nr:EAL domain-containing protein [Shewanella electrodiphila]MCL1046552.1 EAL domain-containing protein [Shewanella electrodiphila]
MERVQCYVVFIVSFFILNMGLKALDYQIADTMIKRDAHILSEKLTMYIEDTAQELKALPQLDDSYACSESNEKLLTMSVFNSTFIRWVGVMDELEVICHSQAIPRHVEKLVRHNIGPDLKLAVINQSHSDIHELFLAHDHGDKQYVASIVPMNPRYFIPVDCKACLEYTITIDGFQDNLTAVPVMEFGFEEFEGEHLIIEEVVQQNEYYIAKFSLTGNEEYLKQYQSLSWEYRALISFLIALAFTVAFWYRKQSQGSTRANIKKGIKNKEFIPFYQPVINSQSNEIVGVEVLMRWRQFNGDLIPPNQFIPFAESAGLIVDMTYSMLNVMVDEMEITGQQVSPLFISINIVPEHLEDDKLYQYIKSLKESGKLGKHRVSLEITERQPITDLVKAREMLDNFYSIGVDLKLDDAGMGYGGFSYVQKLGISTLKIDKAFIDTIGVKDNFNEKTLDAIISFAKKSGLSVIAEGVETESQVNYLSQQGVDLIQGYFFSKPLDSKTFFTTYHNS